MVFGIGYAILLSHSLGLVFTYFTFCSIFREAQPINKKKSFLISYMNPEEGCEVRTSYVTRLTKWRHLYIYMKNVR